MLAGKSTDRMIVASIRTATPRPSPNCWRPMIRAHGESAKDRYHDGRRARDLSGRNLDSLRDRVLVAVTLVICLLDPAQQEHVIVHR